MENNNQTNLPEKNNSQNGKGLAIASLVLGIASVAFWFTGTLTILSLILGIVGIVLASSAKKKGFEGGIRTAGFVLSIIGTVFGAVIFVSCVACIGTIGAIGSAASSIS